MRSAAGPARPLSLFLGAGLCLATGGLVFLGYLATREWRKSSLLVMERQADLTLALLSTALNRNMRGAQVSVLFQVQPEQAREDPPYDLREAFAGAFSRFPYPEFFFVAPQVGPSGPRAWMFTRAGRPPPWDPVQPHEARVYPVVMRKDPPALRGLWNEVRQRAGPGRRFVVFDWEQGGIPYQVVAQYLTGVAPSDPPGVVGFAVNLRWVREHYFGELLGDISRIGGSPESVSLAVLDESGKVVAQAGPLPSGAAVRRWRFPLLYFDLTTGSLLSSGPEAPALWTAQVGAAHDRMLAAAGRGAHRTFVLLTLAAGASVVGMLLTVRAVRVRAELAAMKSDFVSTVTHELKAPLALIRLVGDTLVLGRYTSADAIRDYARLLSQQAQRLTRLIDNLLTYARVSDVQRSYAFEPLDVADVMEDALDRFRPRLEELGFEVSVDVPVELPPVRADRVALGQALDNVVDNAIKYSGAGRGLAVRAAARDGMVRLEVADRGRGIPEAELPRVFERFYRGRRSGAGGSGLGLAIVRSVVEDHGGRVEIASRVDEGTTVTLWLPAA